MRREGERARGQSASDGTAGTPAHRAVVVALKPEIGTVGRAMHLAILM